MKFYPYKCFLVGALTLSMFGFAYPAVPENASDSRVQEQPRIKEKDAVKALTKLGIPMQQDPQGVVRWIEATKKEFSDEAMAYLPSLSGLEWLEIGGGKLSSSGMAHIKDCPALKRLFIHDIDLSNDSLQWLAPLTRLESLSLQRTGINGSVLGNIKAVDTLRALNLSGNPLNDAALESIARIKGLEVVALADTQITGLGIEKFREMPRLNELNVMHCNIQDADLEIFLTTPNLRIVYAEGCPLSDYGIARTIARFPMLAIFR
jgi:hypothetical protein